MRVNLTVETWSARGADLARRLQDYVELLEFRCSCPNGEPCSVFVEEGPGSNWDVIVVRPGYVEPPGDFWVVVRREIEREYRYVASFANPSAAIMVSAILHLVGAPLIEML